MNTELEARLRREADVDPHLPIDPGAVLARGHSIVRRRRLAAVSGVAAACAAFAIAMPQVLPLGGSAPNPLATLAHSPSLAAESPTATSTETEVTSRVVLTVPNVTGAPATDLTRIRVGLGASTGGETTVNFEGVRADGSVADSAVWASLPAGSATWATGSTLSGMVVGAVDADVQGVRPLLGARTATAIWRADMMPTTMADGHLVSGFVIRFADAADAATVTGVLWTDQSGVVHAAPARNVAQALFTNPAANQISVYLADPTTLAADIRGQQVAAPLPTGDARFTTTLAIDEPKEDGASLLARAGVLPAGAGEITASWASGVTGQRLLTKASSDGSAVFWYAEGSVAKTAARSLGTVTWTDANGLRHNVDL